MSDALQKVLLGKDEGATPGTDATPTPAADAIRIETGKFSQDIGEIDRKVVKLTYGNAAHGIVKKGMKLDVEFFMRGSGSLGVSPDWAPIISCGGHTVTNNAGISVVIDPVTAIGANRKASTFYWYEDGLLWKFVGAILTAFSFDGSMDADVKAKASIVAPWMAPVAGVFPLAGLTYQNSDPITVDTTDVITDAGAAIAVGKFAFDANLAGGVKRKTGSSVAHITSRAKPNVTLTKASLATVDDYSRLTAMTSGAISAVFGAAGNRITFAGPRALYSNVEPMDDMPLMDRQIKLALYESVGGGDDAYSWTLD